MTKELAFPATPTRLLGSYRLLNSPVGTVIRQEGRSCWGIALKIGGKTCYTQSNRQYLSDKNHVILLPKGGHYSWVCTEPGECIIIDFDAPEDGSEIRCIEVSNNSFILSAFSAIEKCMNLHSPVSHLEAMGQLYGLLAFLLKVANRKYISSDQRKILEPAITYLTERYSDPFINNDTLSALCGVSTVYFRKVFTAVFGVSPIRYLQGMRIQKAKSILSGDYASVSQVAQSVGYSSVYHFSKMFRLCTGMSPSEYAKNAHP